MNPEMICEVQTRTNYGQTYYYPKNENARNFARLIDRKTLTIRDLQWIAKLGFLLKDGTDNPELNILFTLLNKNKGEM